MIPVIKFWLVQLILRLLKNSVCRGSYLGPRRWMIHSKSLKKKDSKFKGVEIFSLLLWICTRDYWTIRYMLWSAEIVCNIPELLTNKGKWRGEGKTQIHIFSKDGNISQWNVLSLLVDNYKYDPHWHTGIEIVSRSDLWVHSSHGSSSILRSDVKGNTRTL